MVEGTHFQFPDLSVPVWDSGVRESMSEGRGPEESWVQHACRVSKQQPVQTLADCGLWWRTCSFFCARQKNAWMQLCQELAEIQSAREASRISWVLEHPGLLREKNVSFS